MEVRTASRRRGGAKTRNYQPRYWHRGAILPSNVPSDPLLLRGLVEWTVVHNGVLSLLRGVAHCSFRFVSVFLYLLATRLQG